jgi:glycosyltransferase involved in cell wall biosynthesis
VSTNVGGVAEIIEDEQSGSLAPAGDPARLAASILRIVREPGLRERLSKRGRDRAIAKFSEQRMHDGYLQLYGEMLNGSRV